MREVQVLRWCDMCADQDAGTREPATVTTAPLAGLVPGKPRTLDLCEPHAKELLGPLQHLLAEYGATADAPAPRRQRAAAPAARSGGDDGPTPGRYTANTGKGGAATIVGPFLCQVSGCTAQRKPARHLDSLKGHLAYAHNIKLTDYQATYGEPVVATAEEVAARGLTL